MKNELVDRLACPTCLGELEVQGVPQSGDLKEGKLLCQRCHVGFPVQGGVCVFGMRNDDQADKMQEMDGENKWVCSANDLAAHVDYARTSQAQSEATLQLLLKRFGSRPRSEIRVLDIGAGWGALQSWQFATAGFNVVATEISPEFLFAADVVVANRHFERVVADATVLPFRNNMFDIIFCKEVIHHLPDPTHILRELWRVAAPGAWVALREPCSSILVSKARLREEDPAVKAGITHYYYSYMEYLRHFRRISKGIEVETGYFVKLNPRHHPMLAKLQKILWSIGGMISHELSLETFLMLFGGEVSLLAKRADKYGGEIAAVDRRVIPIDLSRLQRNAEQLAYYKDVLVPEVFEYFLHPRPKESLAADHSH